MRRAALTALLLLLLPALLAESGVARASFSARQVRQAERAWLEASGWVLAQRRACGSWEAARDPALSGLVGREDGVFTTSLGQLEAKQTAAQSGWCRVVACLLDSLGIGPRDTVAVTMTGSFPGLNLAVLLTLEAGGIPYACVSSLGASTFGANDSSYNWPRVEDWLRARGLLRQGSAVITPGGSGDRLNGLGLDALRAAERELRRHPQTVHPATLAQAVELREEALGPPERRALLINVGGGHPVIGGNEYGRQMPGGLLEEAECPREPLPEAEPGQVGVLQRWYQQGVPVLHFLDIVRLARRWGLPAPPAEAETPAPIAAGCRPVPPAKPRKHP